MLASKLDNQIAQGNPLGGNPDLSAVTSTRMPPPYNRNPAAKHGAAGRLMVKTGKCSASEDRRFCGEQDFFA
jgi:hypothetical protein